MSAVFVCNGLIQSTPSNPAASPRAADHHRPGEACGPPGPHRHGSNFLRMTKVLLTVLWVLGTSAAWGQSPPAELANASWCRQGTAPNLLPLKREKGNLYDDSAFSANRQRVDDERAFLKVARQSGSHKKSERARVAMIVMDVAVHAAVTWDAQSTNHFFHHYPEGYRPSELDPLMRPFAGKVLMYPMANLLFGAPFDLLLFKTRHSQKPIKIFTYAAASFWGGLEVRQSIVNIGNEHMNRRK